MPPVEKGGEIMTCITPAARGRVGISSPTSCSEEANGGGGRGRKRPFLWVSSLCMACQDTSPPLCLRGSPSVPSPPSPCPAAGAAAGSGAQATAAASAGECRTNLFQMGQGPRSAPCGVAGSPLPPSPPHHAPTIPVLWARTGSISRKTAGNPPSSAPLPKNCGLAAIPAGP